MKSDLNLFLEGIQQAGHGDPMGVINAIGYPIAADAGLITVAAGLETIVLVNAVVLALGGELVP